MPKSERSSTGRPVAAPLQSQHEDRALLVTGAVRAYVANFQFGVAFSVSLGLVGGLSVCLQIRPKGFKSNGLLTRVRCVITFGLYDMMIRAFEGDRMCFGANSMMDRQMGKAARPLDFIGGRLYTPGHVLPAVFDFSSPRYLPRYFAFYFQCLRVQSLPVQRVACSAYQEVLIQ